MKRNKGKVHPFSSSSSSSSPNNESVLNLLPAAIIALVSVLSLDERHVLAYMISRSLKSTNPPPPQKSKNHHHYQETHGGAGLFDCDCFHCYTTFWFRWDSSPNRELIHQAIEAFEDHLTAGEFKKNKKKDKSSRRRQVAEKLSAVAALPPEEILVSNNIGAAETVVEAAMPAVVNNSNNHSRRGLARKMLPDVMGIFNSRLWSLWSPNV